MANAQSEGPHLPVKDVLTPDRIKQLRDELEADGVAVLPGVLSHQQCNESISQLQQWLEKFGDEGFPETELSIVIDYNLPHHPAAWLARLCAAPVFEAIWGTDKLTTSTDGVTVGRPPERGHEDFWSGDVESYPLHTDQTPERLGLHAYQAAVYFEEALEEDWCLVVVDKSHLYHQEHFERTGRFSVGSEDVDWFVDRGCKLRRIAVPKGGMVMWDSRTVHCGARPVKGRVNSERWRFVAFVCMAPVSWALPEDMELKREAYHNLRSSAHWPSDGFVIFPRAEDVDPELNAVDELPEIARTERARRLVGDLEYSEDGRPSGPPKPQWAS